MASSQMGFEFHLVERVYGYKAVLGAATQELEQRKDAPKEERKKFKEFQSPLLSAEGLDVLAENANQVAENAAEDAAEAEVAIVTAKIVTQGVGQDLAQGPQDKPSNPFQDQNPDPLSSFDHLPEQLLYKRKRLKPTNRLRAETLVTERLSNGK
ncbi:hypothetical protein BGX24_001881 [Mortierella sp. AD032]|nr:hypothetical protein BGX24_001881 [Mortierella sp. AD032]